MLQTVSTLNAVISWIEKIVLAKVQLQKPINGERLDKYELVKPSVHIGWVPFGSALPQTDQLQIPCLVVGLDSSDASSDQTVLQIQITAVVYDPGHQTYAPNGDALQLQPNFDGYTTLLNLLDHVRACLLTDGKIFDQLELSGSVKLKTYEEQPWPYWYGYLSFAVIGEPYPQTSFANILN